MFIIEFLSFYYQTSQFILKINIQFFKVNLDLYKRKKTKWG